MNRIKTFIVIASAAICSIGSNPVKGQMMVRIAGNGTCGHTGNGGPAKAAELCGPWGVGVDSVGDVFFGDWYGNTMRKISATSGIISNFAGNGTNIPPAGVAGGMADTASIGGVWTITFDTKGNLYFNEGRDYLRKIATDGTLTTITGLGGAYPGDGHPATASGVFVPGSFVVDKSGNIFFGDVSSGATVIRKIDASGIMTTIAGGGTDTTGEGVSAMTASMTPAGIAIDNSGNIYYSDLSFGHHRIRKISTSGIVNTVIGLGTDTTNGATTANTAYNPAYNADLAFSPAGELYYAENYKIRKISKTGIVTTVVGTGGAGFTGDSVVAATSMVNGVNNIGFDPRGNLYFCDEGNEAVWKVIFSTEEVSNTISYNHVAISPNPCTGIFTCNMTGITTNAKIVVSNAIGQVVYNGSISSPQTQIDISSQPSGVYFAKIIDATGDMIATQKLVKL